MKARAYYMMYLTLMLILVSFLVGSFVRKAITRRASATIIETTKQSNEVLVPTAVDTFTLESVFITESELDLGRVEALATVLRQHDILAELTVYPSELGSFEGALGRSATLLRALVKNGISLEIVHAYASTRKNGNAVEVRLFHAA